MYSRFIPLTLVLLISTPVLASGPWNADVVGHWAEGPSNAVEVQDGRAYLGNGGYLEILDVSDSYELTRLGRIFLSGIIRDIRVVGNRAYVSNGLGGLRLVDVSDPTDPYELGFYQSHFSLGRLTVEGNFAYVASGDLRIINISNPDNVFHAGYVIMPGSALDVCLFGEYAYVTNGTGGLRVMDVDPVWGASEITAVHTGGGNAVGLAIEDSLAYVATSNAGLRIFDLSDPEAPVETGFCGPGGSPRDVAVNGGIAYVASSDHLRVVDAADPSNPVLVGSLDLGETVDGIRVVGDMVYVTADQEGLLVVDVSDPANPVLTDTWRTAEDGRAVAVQGGFAYLARDHDGIHVLDVTDPSLPTEVGFYATPPYVRDMVPAGDQILFAADDNRLHIVDFSDPALPTEIGSFATGHVEALFVTGDLAYLARGNAGLQIVDLSDPTALVEVGQVDLGFDVADVQVQGDYAYVAGDGYYDAMAIIDVSDPANPVQTDFLYTGYGLGIAVQGDHAYLAGGYDGMRVVDISDPFDLVVKAQIDNGYHYKEVAVLGNYLYLAGGRGLEIYDVSDPADPVLAGEYPRLSGIYDVVLEGGLIYTASRNCGMVVLQADIPGVTPVPVAQAGWGLQLSRATPNPFNPATSLGFTLPEPSAVTLDVFDLSGHRVRTLIAGRWMGVGPHAATWNGRDDTGRTASGGVYLYRLRAGGEERTGRMTLLK